MRSEGGYSLVEMMVATLAFMAVFSAIMAIVKVSTSHQEAVASRVAANQRARPAMTRIIDALHSSCVAPGVAPVLAGSTGSSLAFVSKAGSAVSPTPDKRVVTLIGSALSESIYPATGGSPPTWTFAGTPSSTRQLLTGVSAGSVGSPPTTVPTFQYFGYQGGQVSTTPLPTPLSAANAALAVQVTVTFATAPSASGTTDPNERITLSDSATMRLEPASEDTGEVNLPCV